jgi:hypothetical protein
MEKKEKTEVLSNAFHKHLDDCERCRNHPFNLCEEGYLLLKAAAIYGKQC